MSERPRVATRLSLAAALACVAPSLAAAQFAIEDMRQATSLGMDGEASVGVLMPLNEAVLLLTPAEEYVSGIAWHPVRQPVAENFEIDFSFRLGRWNEDDYGPRPRVGDGFALVIQGDVGERPVFGQLGGRLGYEGVPNSLALEFDTYRNKWDTAACEVSVHTRGTEMNSADETASIGRYVPPQHLADQAWHNCCLTFSDGRLRVTLDNIEAPVIDVAFDLANGGVYLAGGEAAGLSLEDGRAWIGFVGTTGKALESHEIGRWHFRPTGESTYIPEKTIDPVDQPVEVEPHAKVASEEAASETAHADGPSAVPWGQPDSPDEGLTNWDQILLACGGGFHYINDNLIERFPTGHALPHFVERARSDRSALADLCGLVVVRRELDRNGRAIEERQDNLIGQIPFKLVEVEVRGAIDGITNAGPLTFEDFRRGIGAPAEALIDEMREAAIEEHLSEIEWIQVEAGIARSVVRVYPPKLGDSELPANDISAIGRFRNVNLKRIKRGGKATGMGLATCTGIGFTYTGGRPLTNVIMIVDVETSGTNVMLSEGQLKLLGFNEATGFGDKLDAIARLMVCMNVVETMPTQRTFFVPDIAPGDSVGLPTGAHPKWSAITSIRFRLWSDQGFVPAMVVDTEMDAYPLTPGQVAKQAPVETQGSGPGAVEIGRGEATPASLGINILEVAGHVAAQSYGGYCYGPPSAGEHRIDDVNFIVAVLHAATQLSSIGGELRSPRIESEWKRFMFFENLTTEDRVIFSRLVGAKDARISGVQKALTYTKLGTPVISAEARAGDFVHYWTKKSADPEWSLPSGHVAIISQVKPATGGGGRAFVLFGAHERMLASERDLSPADRKGGIGESVELNLDDKEQYSAFFVRWRGSASK